MNIEPISISEIVFRHKIKYAPNCYLEENIKNFKNKNFLIRNDYIDNKLISTLIYVSKAGKWIKSKLKMYKNDKCVKVLKSHNDRMV